jgi:hypothetical protein
LFPSFVSVLNHASRSTRAQVWEEQFKQSSAVQGSFGNLEPQYHQDRKSYETKVNNQRKIYTESSDLCNHKKKSSIFPSKRADYPFAASVPVDWSAAPSCRMQAVQLV